MRPVTVPGQGPDKILLESDGLVRNGMNRKWHVWKKLAGAALALLLIADAGLAIYLWQSGREGPEEMRAERDRLAAEAKLLRADIARG